MSGAVTASLHQLSAPTVAPLWAADVSHALFSSTTTERTTASTQQRETDADIAAALAPPLSSLPLSSSASRSPPAVSQAAASHPAPSPSAPEFEAATAESSQPPLSRKRRHRSDDGGGGSGSGDGAAPAVSPSPPVPSSLTLCVKPEWIHHSGAPIYSCDLDPTGLRLATAGADHNLCIWALPPLLSAEAELSPAPKLLATLGNHLNPVNCVRFSSSGRMLASCSDGSSPVVMLWQLHGEADEGFESSRPFGAEASEDVDRWSLHAQLRGHSADIQDLSFSPDCRLLASASVDNSIIVWDVRTLEARRRLKGHKGWVKGVSWDPLGRYLCSFGDDGSLIVWDGADDWKVKRCLSEDFAGGEEQQAAAGGGAGAVAGGRKLVGRIGLNEKLKQIVFSRLSWSADGRLFGASRGFDRVVPVSPVFSRGTWKRRFFYVGHKHPTTVTKFNPRMFTRQPLQSSSASAAASASSSSALSSAAASSSGAKRRSARSHVSSRAIDHTASQPVFYPTHTVCAVGSLDNTISIWLTSEPAPIAHVELFFAQAVVDLAWSADGYTLLACSHDGSVALFRFTQDDLGRALTEEETNVHLHHVYGRERLAVGAAGGAANVVESVTGLEVEAMGREYEQRLRRMREGGEAAAETDGQAVRRTTSSAKVTTAEVLAKQKEGRKLDAKGRVRRLLQPVHVEGGTVFSSAAAAPLVFAPLSPVQDFNSEQAATNGVSSSFTSHLTSSALFDPQDPTPPSIPLVEPSEPDFHVPKQRRRDADTASAVATPSSHKKKKHTDSQHSTAAEAASAAVSPPVASSSSSFPSLSGAAWSARPRFLIPAAPIRPLLCKLPAASSALVSSGSAADVCVVEVLHHQSGASPSAGSKAFTSLVCRRGGVEQWQTLLAAHCSLLQSSSSCLIACCRDSLSDDSAGSVHFLSLTGRRLLPPVHLSAPPAFLCCSPRSSSDASYSPCQYALVLTSDAQLRVFELSGLRCVQDVSAASLLSSASLAAARLLPDGRAVVMLSDGRCWLWEKSMDSWLSLSDGDFFASDFRSRLTLPTAAQAAEDGSSLQAVQREADSRTTTAARPSLLNLDARTRTMHTVAHLESQLAASLHLCSSSEYQRWFQLYVQQLVSLANAEDAAVLDFGSSSPVTAPLTNLALARLQETLAAVLPPLHSVLPSAAGSRDGSLDLIAGVDRLSLLRSVLPVVASSRQLQRMAEWLLRAIREREQRRAERDREREQAARDGELRDGREERARLPSLFPWLTGSGLVERQSNGFHSSSSSSSPSSEQLNGHAAQHQASKHLQLEQRISGGHHNNNNSAAITNAVADSAAAAAASSAPSSSSSFPGNGWR